MKKFLALLPLLMILTTVVHAEEPKTLSMGLEEAEDIGATSTQSAEHATIDEAAPVAEEPIAPEAVEPAAVTVPAVTTPAVSSPTATVVPAALPAQAPAVAVSSPAAKASVPCVAPLEKLVAYHEAEIASLKTTIAQWNEKVGSAINARQAITEANAEKTRKIAELEKQGGRDARKQAAALRREIQKSGKDLQNADRDIKARCRDVASEARALTGKSQQAFRDVCQQAISEAQRP